MPIRSTMTVVRRLGRFVARDIRRALVAVTILVAALAIVTLNGLAIQANLGWLAALAMYVMYVVIVCLMAALRRWVGRRRMAAASGHDASDAAAGP